MSSQRNICAATRGYESQHWDLGGNVPWTLGKSQRILNSNTDENLIYTTFNFRHSWLKMRHILVEYEAHLDWKWGHKLNACTRSSIVWSSFGSIKLCSIWKYIKCTKTVFRMCNSPRSSILSKWLVYMWPSTWNISLKIFLMVDWKCKGNSWSAIKKKHILQFITQTVKGEWQGKTRHLVLQQH